MKTLHSILFSATVVSSLLLLSVTTSCTDKTKAESADASAPTEQVKQVAPNEKDAATANVVEQDTDTITAGSSPETPQEKTKLTPVYMGVWGNVGGTGFNFDMDGTKGSYIPYDMVEAKEYGERRQLELVSYDPKSGKCVINAFLKGKYIGQFSGTFNEEEVEMEEGSYTYQNYEGVFTSVKGAKLDFHFHYD